MKLKIFISKEKLIILLFLATYIYCNLVSLLLFPSDPKIFRFDSKIHKFLKKIPSKNHHPPTRIIIRSYESFFTIKTDG